MNKRTKKTNIGLISFIILGFLLIINWIKIPCLFHTITGYFCPGCGMTRSLRCLIKFDIKSAIHYNTLIVLLIPFFAYYTIQLIHYQLKEKRIVPLDEVYSTKILMLVLLIIIAFGIIRNIPIFNFLIP